MKPTLTLGKYSFYLWYEKDSRIYYLPLICPDSGGRCKNKNESYTKWYAITWLKFWAELDIIGK